LFITAVPTAAVVYSFHSSFITPKAAHKSYKIRAY